MAAVCRKSPIPIALDEELIGHYAHSDMQMLLERIAPQYLVLKPSLHGGLAGARRWQKLARQHSIGAWVTSALESSFGLNALAHFTAACGFEGHQGLGLENIREALKPYEGTCTITDDEKQFQAVILIPNTVKKDDRIKYPEKKI